jgi:hypothetical protein
MESRGGVRGRYDPQDWLARVEIAVPALRVAGAATRIMV